MINSLTIKNFALIKDIDLNFEKGFNVLVGETGAGKSIILSAIQFALGAKIDKSIIRTGENFTKVNVCFSNLTPSTREFLMGYGIEFSEELVISRSLNLDGKNDCRANGDMINLTMLRTIAETLIDSYYQNEAVQILNVKNHIKMLDGYDSITINNIKNNLAEIRKDLKQVDEKIKMLGGSSENRERDIDILKFQISEIEEMNLVENEDIEIQAKIKILNNAEKISSAIDNASSMISNSQQSCLTLIKESCNEINRISNLDESFNVVVERLNAVRYELEDVYQTLDDFKSNIYYDESLLLQLDSRLDKIKALKRKYGSTVEEIKNFCALSQEKLNYLVNADEEYEKLNCERIKILKKLYDICIELSNHRKKIAKEIEEKISAELVSLGMKNAKFVVCFRPISEFTNEFSCGADGADDIEFMFSANLGENVKNISKAISGGEMSRFMLALKNILVDKDGVDTLILDEVDSGISGEIGSKVAEKIGSISKHKQVICITHLSQVTAMADNYIFVYKQVEDKSTHTNIKSLTESEIIEYIAKLSNPNLSDNALKNACELKSWANEYKNSI